MSTKKRNFKDVEVDENTITGIHSRVAMLARGIEDIKQDALKSLSEIDRELERLEEKLMMGVRTIKCARDYAERVANKIQGDRSD